MSNQQVDLASFIAALFAVFVAPPLAHLMGIYTAIIIGAVFGAGLAVVRAEAMTRAKAVRFALLMAGVAVVTTVGLAELANHWIHLSSINSLVAPLSLVIAAVGQDWPKVAARAWAVLLRVFERRAGGGEPPQESDHE